MLYEIWSLGHKPFEDRSTNEVYTNNIIDKYPISLLHIQAIELLCNDYRLPPPPGCPRQLYQIMMDCWYVAIDKLGFN